MVDDIKMWIIDDVDEMDVERIRRSELLEIVKKAGGRGQEGEARSQRECGKEACAMA